MTDIREIVEKALEKGNGILNLKPAWVARDFLPPGRRLGLPEKDYDVGERGFICERWLASVTKADNATGPEDEGLSYLANIDSKQEVTLKSAVDAAGDLIMGKEYSKTHKGLGRLAKIYDFGARIPYHIHQMEKDAKLVGRNSKDEAYYFPEDVDTGPHPETFFGVHPYIVDEKKYDILLPYLVEWKDDMILQHSRAYLNVPGEGFFLPSGVLHAPGTALTIELQEDSDVFAMLQALNAGKIISKELLFKDVRKEDREKLGERVILNQLDWPANGDPFFYENHHLPNIFIEETRQDGGVEHWIYYNTTKFSGKRLVVKPGQSFTSKENGVYNILVWRGKGTYDGHKIEAGNFQCDELLISHDRAVKPLTVKNEGKTDLLIIKFFGPDINTDVPKIKPYKR
ncbi:MAG: hypothetical protein M1479_10355 [Actinobacteria bacterium]|nr:hypothetical protein [Cyanobacteriota bacterium]MCL5772654.1 hypothetical protein [Actinomycetota bacterium]